MKVLGAPRICLSSSEDPADAFDVAVGLAHALRKKGRRVSISSHRTAFAQSAILRRLSGVPVSCLEPELLTEDQILESLYVAGLGVDCLIVVCNSNVLDSGDGDLAKRPVDIASLTRTPLFITHSCRFPGETQRVFLDGLLTAITNCSVKGLFLNNWKACKDSSTWLSEVRQHVGVSTLVHEIPSYRSRPPHPLHDEQHMSAPLLPRSTFDCLSEHFLKGNVLEDVLGIARQAPGLQIRDPRLKLHRTPVKIALAEDICFSFMYQDNIKLLQYCGVEFIPFSPLTDVRIPKEAKVVWLPGGYITAYAHELTQNKQMYRSLRSFFDDGGKIIAESASTAYLSETFTVGPDEERFIGVGIIPGAVRHGDGSIVCDRFTIPVPSFLGERGLEVGAAACGAWEFCSQSTGFFSATGKRKGTPLHAYIEMHRVMAVQGFFHLGSTPKCIRELLAFCTA